MESCEPNSDKCNVNGNCSPPAKLQSLDLNHAKNIDDISTPSDLKFDQEFVFEDPDIIEKKNEIESCLKDPDSVSLEKWQSFAKSKGGLISDTYRRRIWPLLVGVTQDEMTEPPSLEELSAHREYSQVVLDVNRSLKRFPPGVPLARRLALQDQLTVLILRVIMRHPHLNYYQGYHDVAITLLLVCGARAAFPLLARLSAGGTAPLEPFLRRSLLPAQRRLALLLPALRRAHPALADHMLRSGVGTMFALPWFLTWFGHSLPRYRDVVRLYDYFLCAAPLFPVYVTAAIVLHRADEVLECECDMAMLHCLLSRLPDELPFEELLEAARVLQERHPPDELEPEARLLEEEEEERRRRDEERMRARREARAARALREAGLAARLRRLLPARLHHLPHLPARGLVLAGAAALLGVYVYYRPDLLLR